MPSSPLHLVVTNPEQLMHGCRPQYLFDEIGGSVGCDSATWLLRDNAGTIAPRHFEITVRDGHFCIADSSGLTHLNGDPQPMGVGRIARLGEGDRIDIGPYRLAVSLSAAATATFAGIESHGDILDVVPAKHNVGAGLHLDRLPGDEVMLDRTHYGQSIRQGTHGDGAGHTSEAVIFGNDAGDPRGSAEALAALEEGLGVKLGPLEAGATRALLREVGQALRAAIEGMVALQARAPRGGSPIEDNPLRLGLDIVPTLQALFGAQHSPFHLRPAAAMSDGLAQVAQQQLATQAAIDAGVGALLDAFAPQALTQRFERYAGDTPRDGEWLWSMYGAYYREVMTSQGQGAQRLFRGAFSDALDRALRQGRNPSA